MKTVLIISYSSLHRDPRILRQIQALEGNYKIVTIGYTPALSDCISGEITHYTVNRPRRSTFPEKIKRLFQYIKKEYLLSYKKEFDLENIHTEKIETPDVVIANDWNGLYSAVSLKKENKWLQTKIYFDAHEYAPEEFINLKWHLFMHSKVVFALRECRDYIDAMSTVCDGIAKEYERFFNFPSDSITVITNAPEYNMLLSPTTLHNDKVRLIHHGGAIKARKLELMIKMMQYLDPEKYELTFMLVPAMKEYYDYLVNTARQFKNIHFIEPVETVKIAQTINNFDIGIYILKGHGFNNDHALPNKFFEYIQARLAIAIGPSVEMANIVGQYNLGVCSKSFSPKALARSIMTLSRDEIMNYKNNADKYARELSAENNLIKIRNIVDDLAGE
jgi:hypothetical protein